MEAYCLKCKEKREIKDPVAGFTRNGSAITTGFCPVCNSKLSKLGTTPAHEGLVKPEISKPVRKAKAVSGKAAAKKTARSSRTVKSAGKRAIPAEFIGKGNELVVVESPTKARSIGKFLGDKYSVIASVGHVRDLLKTQLSVDVDHDFAPKYRISDDKKAIVAAISNKAERSKTVYLATDPDREGEAIAWHIQESAEIPESKVKRVAFHEITREAVAEAFAKPRAIDMDLVDAQQARRILDRLVGFGISPILWSKVRGGLSAGRVQSIALRLIVERERKIQDFRPVEFWVMHGLFETTENNRKFLAKLIRVNGKEPDLPDEKSSQALTSEVRKAVYNLDSLKSATRKQRPGAPFITSTMQQEASRRISFTTKKTMQIAQQLYEGIDLGNGELTGLITYMRTDSVHVAPAAVNNTRGYIKAKFGTSYLPATAPVYKTRAASAQEAHEAIRPTNVHNEPDSIREYLSNDQYKLYKLIWQRFVASQMQNAIIETTTADVLGQCESHSYLFRAVGSKTTFKGYQALYADSKAEDKTEDDENVVLPMEDLKEGMPLNLTELDSKQHFTQPLPRFTEASLIQVLEENKIGRPSTYSPIISAIQERGYVSRESKRLYPTETGFLVNDLVVAYFPEIVDLKFTSDMEDELDQIADGKKEWVSVIREFYTPFENNLKIAKEEMPVTRIKPESAGRPCPKCGHDLVIRNGRYGKFISCSDFPNCRYTEPIVEKIGLACPKCGAGEIIVKRSKKGRVFYGCSRFPECDFVSCYKPIAEKCPDCGGTLVLRGKNTKSCLECKASFDLNEEA